MIRQEEEKDLEELKKLYAAARVYMKKTGNPHQWGDTHPTEAIIEEDIHTGHGYVIEEEGAILGAFALCPGPDPTYRVIEEGQWLNEKPYLVLHRVAGIPGRKTLRKAVDFALQQCPDLRIDTHEDNKIMQHLLEKYGFRRCGIIYVRDHSPRIAYQLPAAPPGV